MVATDSIGVQTRGEGDVQDVTAAVQAIVSASGIRDGLLCVFVVGSTAAVGTIEFEPGLVTDMAEALERLLPRDAVYAHEERWKDDNGHSHLRATLLGPSLVVPVVEGKLTLGQWQQIVLLEQDTQPRERRLIVQISGED
jgi:secondary thiamine-phosphate synthase enzyme